MGVSTPSIRQRCLAQSGDRVLDCHHTRSRDGRVTLHHRARGALYRTGTDGQWVKLGVSEFARSKFLVGIDGRLYTIEENGSLYSILVE